MFDSFWYFLLEFVFNGCGTQICKLLFKFIIEFSHPVVLVLGER